MQMLRRNRMKKTTLLAVIFCLFMPAIAGAQGLKEAFGNNSPLDTVANKAGVKDVDNVGKVSGRVINTALSLVGLIFLILMVYGGYLWMTARGDESQVEKAQMIIRNAIIGLVLVLAAYAITVLVTTRLGKSS